MPNHPDVRVRVAVPEDEAELALLDRRAWSPLHAVTPRPQPPHPPFFSDRHPPQDCLVAEDGGRLAGYTHLGSPTPVLANRHVLQIQGLSVDPSCQGQGLGRQLVEAAVAEAARRGARRLTLRVLGGNVPARALYEACGFVVEGVLREEFRLGGRYVDDVLMAPALT